MIICEKYLNALRNREPELFPNAFPASNLTPTALQEIEKTIKHTFPNQYKEFLLSKQIPNTTTVFISLCGESSMFWDTFSRKQNCEVPRHDDVDVLVDMNWYGINGTCALDWIEELKKIVGDFYIWVDAGYIQLGDFHGEDYFVFYDLDTGKVLKIHNEDIDENRAFWEALRNKNPAAIRAAMEETATDFCEDFNTFLRLICLGEVYDEDKMVFVTK